MLRCRAISLDQYKAQEAFANELNTQVIDQTEGEAGEHPEGFKRGGVVVVLVDEDDDDLRAMYDETDCRWVPYDEEE